MQTIISKIKKYCRKKDYELLKELLEGINNYDIAEILDRLNPIEQKIVLNHLDNERIAEILPEMDDYEDITKNIDNLLLTDLLMLMDDDDATDILQDLSKRRQEKLLRMMEKGQSEEIRQLLQYKEDTAGGLMTLSFLAVKSDFTVGKSIDLIKKSSDDLEIINYLYVTDDDGHLEGVVSIRQLLIFPDNKIIGDIMNRDIIYVDVATDQEEVAKLVSKYDLLAIPVVDYEKKLMGIVTFDDIMDVIDEENAEDIYAMAGSSSIEEETNSVFLIAGLRFPWLFTNLFGGIIAASVLGLYKMTLAKAISLSFFIPVITGMGGNAGLQTSTTTIRGLSTGEIHINEIGKILFREIRIGVIVGILCGFVVGAFSYLWQGHIFLGAVVGISMMCSITIAALVGVIAPFSFKKLGIDPAISSGPFVTTSNDIMGILIYLTIATYMIDKL